MILFVITLALLEVGRQWCYIEVRGIDLNKNDMSWAYPSHKWNTVERMAVTAGVFVHAGVCRGLFFLGLAISAGWYLFHYGLNLARGKSIYYLGKNTIDRFLQKIDNQITPQVRFIIHTTAVAIILAL